MKLHIALFATLFLLLSSVFAVVADQQRAPHLDTRWSCKVTIGPPCPPPPAPPTPTPVPMRDQSLNQLKHSHLFWKIANRRCRDYGVKEDTDYPVVVRKVEKNHYVGHEHEIDVTCKQRMVVDGQAVYMDVVGGDNDVLDITF